MMYFDAFILFKRIASELSVISRRGWRVRRREKLRSRLLLALNTNYHYIKIVQ